MKKSVAGFGFIGLIALFLSSHALALTVGFDNITNNNAGDSAIGEAQLFLDVNDQGGGSQALFTFRNTGPAASVITQIYFDDNNLLSMPSFFNSVGVVNYNLGASPPNLPGGNTASPPFVDTFSFQPNNPQPTNGIGPGESLGILFNIIPMQTFADVVADLTSGDLRAGIHVQAFNSGGSESFVNTPVPLPAAVWLFGSGLLALVGFARRKAML